MHKFDLSHFIKVSITVYVFYMFLYGTWYFLHIQDFANLRLDNEWAGSLVFLPHGARVLMVCFFRYYSLPAPVSYTHLRAHETSLHLVCRLLLEKRYADDEDELDIISKGYEEIRTMVDNQRINQVNFNM